MPSRLAIDMGYVQDVLLRLLRTPSPSGRTDQVMQLVGEELTALGVPFTMTRRGAIVANLRGTADPAGPDRAIVVHADTIGCMVKRVKESGRLELAPIGTHSARFSEGARVTIFVDDLDQQLYTGTILPLMASGHRYGDAVDAQGVGWEQVEVRIDEDVASPDDVAACGIQVGDFVALDAQPEITASGFVRSRHLDDKGGIAAALGACKAVVDAGAELPVDAHLLITIAEEVGLGATHGIDPDVAELVSIDTAVVAPGQTSSEHTVNIVMQDASGPFDYHLARRLSALATEHGIEHRRDLYTYYRSDAASALQAGAETRAAVMGFGIDASHGHERTHLDGIRRTAELAAVYLQTELTFPYWDAGQRGELRDFPSRSVQPAVEQRPC
ncbi:MAG: osmoprotectant NAGGN system M42 family peptidase [Acidimicrobiales bacterium]